MELPSTDKRTCEIAVNWIKKNYPYVTRGFAEAYAYIDLRDYEYSNVVWYDNDSDSDSYFYIGDMNLINIILQYLSLVMMI